MKVKIGEINLPEIRKTLSCEIAKHLKSYGYRKTVRDAKINSATLFKATKRPETVSLELLNKIYHKVKKLA